MSYETGSASSQGDLLDKLNTFAVAAGWTSDDLDVGNRKLALHKGTVYASIRGDGVAVTGSLAIYQALGFSSAGNSYGANAHDDSGNGTAGAGPYTTGRRVNRVGNGPFTAYHFFAVASYLHVALEYSPGLFRHFGFGALDKVGSWTGGEYCYGHVWDMTATGLDYASHSVLFDWKCTDQSLVATLHVEGLPSGFQTSEKWGVLMDAASNVATSVGTARDGVGRLPCIGGVRDGFYQNAIGWIEANPNNGYVPMFPLQAWRSRRGTTPQQWILLGHAPDLRFVNVNFINAGDEFTLGGDTWKCFPWVKKSTGAAAGESGNMGVAYRKVA